MTGELNAFFTSHNVTDYLAAQNHTIRFKIDGVEYLLSPFYDFRASDTSPAGYTVYRKDIGFDTLRELFSFHSLAGSGSADKHTLEYSRMYSEIRKSAADIKPSEYMPFIAYRLIYA